MNLRSFIFGAALLAIAVGFASAVQTQQVPAIGPVGTVTTQAKEAEYRQLSDNLKTLSENFVNGFLANDASEADSIAELAVFIPPVDSLGIHFGPYGYQVTKQKMSALFSTGQMTCEVTNVDALRSNVLVECSATDVTYIPTGAKSNMRMAYMLTWDSDYKVSKIVATDLDGSMGNLVRTKGEEYLQRLLTTAVLEIGQSAETKAKDNRVKLEQIVSKDLVIAAHNFPPILVALLGGQTTYTGSAEILAGVATVRSNTEGFEDLDLNLIDARDVAANIMLSGDDFVVTHVSVGKNHFAVRNQFDSEGLLLRKDVYYIGNW